jgi:hypothetical protein
MLGMAIGGPWLVRNSMLGMAIGGPWLFLTSHGPPMAIPSMLFLRKSLKIPKS